MRCLDLDTGAECDLAAGAAVALGNFDGVHIGHRRLFEALGCEYPRAAFTFCDLRKTDLVCTFDERLAIMRKCGVRYALAAEFAEVRDMPPEAFVDLLCRKYEAKRLVCGFNFTFGARGAGTADDLIRLAAERGVEALAVPPVMLGGEAVSSTRVRAMLAAGDMRGAADALGRRWGVALPVIHGRELGRKMGFPTVNQAFPAELAAPRFGVYASQCVIDGRVYGGATNVGVRPTVDGSDNRAVSVETHIFDFDDDLYGRELRVEFCDFIRGEREFSSTRELFAQIAEDVLEAQKRFKQGLACKVADSRESALLKTEK